MDSINEYCPNCDKKVAMDIVSIDPNCEDGFMEAECRCTICNTKVKKKIYN